MNIALITEGVSEYHIITHILTKYLRKYEPNINQIQPKISNGKQIGFGGWREVLKYCEKTELKDILVENDYLIIQIDSDQSAQKPFDVPHTGDTDKLCDDIAKRLESLMVQEVKKEVGEKIIFAISIHTIECWLLPLYFNDQRRKTTNNCLKFLNQELVKNKVKPIPMGNKNKPEATISYRKALSKIGKVADIDEICDHNIGFKRFIKSIQNITNSRNSLS